MQSLKDETSEEIEEQAEIAHGEREMLSMQIRDLSEEVRRLHRRLQD